MNECYIPFVNEKPLTISVNGHDLVLVSFQKEVFEDSELLETYVFDKNLFDKNTNRLEAKNLDTIKTTLSSKVEVVSVDLYNPALAFSSRLKVFSPRSQDSINCDSTVESFSNQSVGEFLDYFNSEVQDGLLSVETDIILDSENDFDEIQELDSFDEIDSDFEDNYNLGIESKSGSQVVFAEEDLDSGINYSKLPDTILGGDDGEPQELMLELGADQAISSKLVRKFALCIAERTRSGVIFIPPETSIDIVLNELSHQLPWIQ